jgi:phospholipase C
MGNSMAKLLFEHYVVLMLENRSFDHLFGYLGIGEGLPSAGATNYLKPGNSSSKAFSMRKGGDYTAVGDGPSHSLKQTNEQLFGVTKPTPAVSAKTPPMDGFVVQHGAAVRPQTRTHGQ